MCEHALERLRGDSSWPEALQLAREAREAPRRRRCPLEHDPRGRAREAERDGALGQRGLFRDAEGEIRVGPPEPLGDDAGDLLDLLFEG